jgi:hypothetical protein
MTKSPINAKRLRLKVQRFTSLLTSPLRVLPDFLAIGAHKAGTTSFYEYLRQHPMIISAWKKDIKFFDLHYQRGTLWYRSYFSTKYRMKVDRHSGLRNITGDGATDYLYYPDAPQRVADLLPDVKLFLVLRNPVDRAYSHYQHGQRNHWDSLTFEEAIEQESERLKEEAPGDKSLPIFRRFAYLKKGYYAEYLQKWFEIFPRERFFIVRSEDLFSDKALDVYCEAQEFLGLPIWKHINFKNVNPGNYQQMLPETRQELIRHYEPHNQKLYDMLDRDFEWE